MIRTNIFYTTPMQKTENFQKVRILIIILFFIFFFTLLPQKPKSVVPGAFGGVVATVIPCPVSQNIWVTGNFGVGNYSLTYFPYALKYYLYGPPRNPKQNIIGMSAAVAPCIVLVPCPVGVCPLVIGKGEVILFNGSSKI